MRMAGIQSFCPECLRIIPGHLRETPQALVQEKTCPEHGPFRTRVSPDLQTYLRLSAGSRKITSPPVFETPARGGCPEDCGLCPEHDQHTCLAILEITSGCDLGCPVCLASSGPEVRGLAVSGIEAALKRLVPNDADPPALQLSGGEPTLHGHLPEIVRRAAALGFKKIEVDTNGRNLSRDPFLAERLREAGLSGVYLQMDGLEAETLERIRGADLMEEKLQAIENCRRGGLQVVLSVTVVAGINDHRLWDMVEFALTRRLTGVNFQPFVQSGRYPKVWQGNPKRFTTGDFLREIERQSAKRLSAADFMPIPCPDPRCAVIAYALVDRGELIPLNRVWTEKQLREPLADLSDWEQVMRHLDGCCAGQCCSGGYSEIPPGWADLKSRCDFFSIGCHGMMDAWDFDLERARRCCVHEVTAEGKRIPFCLYNIKYRAGARRMPDRIVTESTEN